MLSSALARHNKEKTLIWEKEMEKKEKKVVYKFGLVGWLYHSVQRRLLLFLLIADCLLLFLLVADRRGS
jgi:hypothetical protein